jgi:hypothetical protein
MVIRDLSALQGVKLRSPFASVRARLGNPDTADYSPPDDGDRFGSYTWQARGIAVLTWLADEGEVVWGVRLDAAGDPDPALGFTVGSRRADVLARFPGFWREEENSLEANLDDGRLVVTLQEDRVRSIQLIGPMGPGEQSGRAAQQAAAADERPDARR